MPIQHDMTIKAPVEQVFALLDDEQQLKRWMPGLEETVYTTPFDREHPVGATFRQRIREGGRVTEYEGRVTAYKKPHLLGVAIGNRHFTAQVEYRLSPVPQGTRLEYTTNMTFTTVLGKLMGLLFGWLTRRIARQQLEALRRVAEEESGRA